MLCTCMYWYILVHASTYWYEVISTGSGMYWYIQVHTNSYWYILIRIPQAVGSRHHESAASEFGVIQYEQVRTSTYWYMLVCTGMYNHARACYRNAQRR